MNSIFEILNPWMLTGLAGLFVLVYWHRHTVALLTRRRQLVSLGLRSAILVLIVLALCDPRLRLERKREHLIWLVDVSRSVGEEGLKRYQALAGDPRLQEGFESQSLVVFAGQARTWDDRDLERQITATLDDKSTRLAQALEFANASFPVGYAKTVVLLSDGLETDGDALKQAEDLHVRSGLRIHTVPVESPDFPEVLVRSVQTPRRVSEGEPVKVIAEVASNRKGHGELTFFRSGVKIASRAVEWNPGSNRFEITTKAGDERLVEFSASIQSAMDTVADNNEASSVVQMQGKARALLLSDKPEQSRFLGQALKQEGVNLEIRPPTGAPVDLADLQNYDVLILDNVAATDLDPRQLDLFATYTRDFGGGFLMLGGDQSFGLGGYYRTAVEDILPVRCDFEKERENPSLGLLLVIDRSGSMSGIKMEMAKEAAKAAVELLSPKDFTGVVAFDNEAFWAVDLQSAADITGIQQKIGTIEAGGGTNIAAGLEPAYAQLSQSPAKIKHVILLTDGVSTPGPFQELTTQMANERITVSTVAVGSDSDTRLLQQIAEWGNGRYYFTDNPNTVPQIFAKETMTASKSALQESPFAAKQVRGADFLEGLEFESSPFLLGYVMTRLKPTAELWLSTERGDPLLATWRYGLGRAGAFSSDARNRWGVEWLKWEGFGKFWVQTLRYLSRPASLQRFPVTMERKGNGFVVAMDLPDDRGGFLEGTSGEILVAGPGGHTQKVSMQAVAPGRLEAFFSSVRPGHYHAQIRISREGEIIDSQYAGATVGYSPEFSLLTPDKEKLKDLAEKTEGLHARPVDEWLKLQPRSAQMMMELWPWLTGLALGLFVLDVAFRRWPENPTKL